MFPRLEEGGLATYRAALVQNQFLTVLAEVCLNFHVHLEAVDCLNALSIY